MDELREKIKMTGKKVQKRSKEETSKFRRMNKDLGSEIKKSILDKETFPEIEKTREIIKKYEK